jgi:hypothetical protein
VIKVTEELHLSESSKTEHGVVKRRDLFDGDLLARWFVYRRAKYAKSVRGSTQSLSDIPDNTIGALADDILNVVLLADIERDLARSRRIRGVLSRHVGWVVT